MTEEAAGTAAAASPATRAPPELAGEITAAAANPATRSYMSGYAHRELDGVVALGDEGLRKVGSPYPGLDFACRCDDLNDDGRRTPFLLRGGAAGCDADAHAHRTASAGMGAFRWVTNVGLLVAVVAVGAALNNLSPFPAAAGSGSGLTTATSFFLLALVVAGVNLINAGVCLTGRGSRAETLACTSTTTARRVLGEVDVFARRNVAVLGVAGASSAATGVIVFASDPVLCFVCFVLFLVAISSLFTVGDLARSTRR